MIKTIFGYLAGNELVVGGLNRFEGTGRKSRKNDSTSVPEFIQGNLNETNFRRLNKPLFLSPRKLPGGQNIKHGITNQ